ncbi:MAG: ATP-binding protein [Planctomycetota bacterium]|jgi:serine/threonine-protein kinase RsbW
MNDYSSFRGIFDERFVLRNQRDAIEQMQDRILGEIERHGFGETCGFAIRLALEEALSNAFKHGNKADPRKTVTVHLKIDPTMVDIQVEDEGNGFDPSTIPDPTQEENIEIPCGRGIVLMRAFMSDVQFHPPGNRVQMKFQKPA